MEVLIFIGVYLRLIFLLLLRALKITGRRESVDRAPPVSSFKRSAQPSSLSDFDGPTGC
jgi:hypothetical protein